jgi:lysozyme
MTTGLKGMSLIYNSESLSLKPYLCPAGVPTIGYGSTFYPNGTRVTLKDSTITKDYAMQILMSNLKIYEQCVNKYAPGINQDQFDALVSFCYNVGIGNFKSSTLLKKVVKNRFDPTIQNEFMKWVHAGDKVLPGLVTRRMNEGNLYFSK